MKIRKIHSYWTNTYNKKKIENTPSNFAKFTLKYLKKNNINFRNLLDLGSGNFRDSNFFGNNNLNVVSYDLVDSKNQHLINKTKFSRSQIINDDILNLERHKNKLKNVNIFYSRFFHHAISLKRQDVLHNFIVNSKKQFFFFIETRSINDVEMINKGKKIYKNTYIYEQGHIRRFTDPNELLKNLLKLNLKLKYFEESNSFSISKKNNIIDKPILLRIVLSNF